MELQSLLGALVCVQTWAKAAAPVAARNAATTARRPAQCWRSAVIFIWLCCDLSYDTQPAPDSFTPAKLFLMGSSLFSAGHFVASSRSEDALGIGSTGLPALPACAVRQPAGRKTAVTLHASHSVRQVAERKRAGSRFHPVAQATATRTVFTHRRHQGTFCKLLRHAHAIEIASGVRGVRMSVSGGSRLAHEVGG